MAVTIRIPGYEDYFDGSANVKGLFLGPHGVGKTRWATFWERPLLIAAEDGTASLLDRAIPTADVRTYQDVLDAIALLKREQMTTKKENRRFRTAVLDTADKLQKNLMAEWSKANGGQEFSGWEAWGWLDVRWTTILDKLMELDYHVLVLMHYKEEKDGDTLLQRPRLKGDAQTSILDPFDLIGFIDWEFGLAPKEGDAAAQRTKKRFLSCEPTPKAPWLKDRFHVMPRKLPVDLATGEGAMALFDLLQKKAEATPPAEKLDVIPTAGAEVPAAEPDARPASVVGPLPGGPVPTAAAPKPVKATAAPKAAPAAQPAPAPGGRAAELAAQARARQASKNAEAQETADAAEQAQSFLRAASGIVDPEPAAEPSAAAEPVADVPDAEPVEPGEVVPAATEESETPVQEPAAEPVDEAPADEAPAEPATPQEAVAVVESVMGPTTEIGPMQHPVPEGLGTLNQEANQCGMTVPGAEPREEVIAFVQSGAAGCGIDVSTGSGQDTFVGVSKVKYRVAFCNTCFPKVRQNVG